MALPLQALLGCILLALISTVSGKVPSHTPTHEVHHARRKSVVDKEIADEALRSELEIEYLARGFHCPRPAAPGSDISIVHKGFIHQVKKGEVESWVGKQIDGSIPGQPLNFTVRSQHVLRGMDYAVEGLCIGDRISVVMPPHLAFDDPLVEFEWERQGEQRPAPQGSTVRYEITVVALTKPKRKGGFLIGLGAAAGMAAMIGFAWLLAKWLDHNTQMSRLKKGI